MRQLIDNSGKHIPVQHIGLRNAHAGGGRAGLWESVAKYNAAKHAAVVL